MFSMRYQRCSNTMKEVEMSFIIFKLAPFPFTLSLVTFVVYSFPKMCGEIFVDIVILCFVVIFRHQRIQ